MDGQARHDCCRNTADTISWRDRDGKKRGTLLRRVPLCLQGALRIAELPSVNVILPVSLPTKLHLNGLLCRRSSSRGQHVGERHVVRQRRRRVARTGSSYRCIVGRGRYAGLGCTERIDRCPKVRRERASRSRPVERGRSTWCALGTHRCQHRRVPHGQCRFVTQRRSGDRHQRARTPLRQAPCIDGHSH